MIARELISILMEHPNNEVFVIDYNSPTDNDLKPVHVYNEEEGKTVISPE